MRLEIGAVHIQDVRLGSRTAVADHVLTIDRAELTALLEPDPAFDGVEVELAHPGESCRIIHINDVVEPRFRLEGTNFPGAVGPMGVVGAGHTRALKNVLVVDCNLLAGSHGEHPGEMLDMVGPATRYTPFGDQQVVAVIPRPAAGVDGDEFRQAGQRAGLRAAVYLARAAAGARPDETVVYELPPVALSQGPSDLPRVAHVFHIHSHQHITHVKERVLYGSNVRGFMPTIVHPNEILDGAFVPYYYALTYHVQNHPLILELYRRHRQDLWFAGVVLVLAGVTHLDQERDFLLAAHLAREVLAADAVLCNKMAGGAGESQISQIFTRCEEQGMKAVAVITGARLVSPNVDAIVTLGGRIGGDTVDLPAVERVLGGDTLIVDRTNPAVADVAAESAARVTLGSIAGVCSQTGFSRLRNYVT
jgi:glycine reductase